MKLMVLEDPLTWPDKIIDFLTKNHKAFLFYELGIEQDPEQYYRVENELENLIKSSVDYVLRGYHCSRLADVETRNILTNGMSLASDDMLRSRIAEIEKAGLIKPHIAAHLLSKNEAKHEGRTGIIWFCFYPPGRAGEGGIGDFLKYWGGESLFNIHQYDTLTSGVLTTLGTPSIIEALVPLPFLNNPTSKIVRNYLINAGERIEKELILEDMSLQPISAANIVRIIEYPEKDFLTLTGCSNWKNIKLT